MGRGRSANDQRSNAKNPNNPARTAAVNNRANQMNPKSSAYASSRDGRGHLAVSAPGGGGGGPGILSPGASFEELLDHDIDVNRRAVGNGKTGGKISGVESRLRARSLDSLRELVRSFRARESSLQEYETSEVDSLDLRQLIDLVWLMIRTDLLSKGGSIESYLNDQWIPKYLPEGLPPYTGEVWV